MPVYMVEVRFENSPTYREFWTDRQYAISKACQYKNATIGGQRGISIPADIADKPVMEVSVRECLTIKGWSLNPEV